MAVVDDRPDSVYWMKGGFERVVVEEAGILVGKVTFLGRL